MRVELTDAFLRALRPPARGRIELRDTTVPCLTVRITTAGTASWSVHVRTRDGKRTRPSLGEWPILGIKAARQRARELLVEIAKGGDPVAEKRAARAEREARERAPTVAASLALWREANAGRWSAGYAAEVGRICARIIEPALGKRVLRETTRADWVGLVAAQRASRPGTAAWCYDIASGFLNHAELHGWIEAHPLPRRGRGQIAPRSAPRQRVLSDDQLRRVWQASAELAPKSRCFVRLLVLTGTRVSEAAGIAVGEIDLTAGRWAIPAARAKNRHAITLPLSPLACAELAAVLPDPPTGAGYRLLGHTKGSALTSFTTLKAALDKLSSVTGWTWHDLRRTARTGMSRLGVPREHAEAAINHVGGRSVLERTYDVHDYADEIVSALTRWQEHVARIVTDEPTGAEVIRLRA